MVTTPHDISRLMKPIPRSADHLMPFLFMFPFVLPLYYIWYVYCSFHHHDIPLFPIWRFYCFPYLLSSFIVLCTASINYTLPRSFLYISSYSEWAISPLSIYDLHITLPCTPTLRTEGLVRANKKRLRNYHSNQEI